MKLNFLKLLKQKLINRTKKAFSLNDLSVLMSTIAIVAVSAVAISNIQNIEQKEKADSQKTEEIYKAIGNFLVKNKRLPCPASITKIRGKDSNYGAEESDGSKNCNVGGGVYYISSNPNLLYGTIPTLSLGLSSDYAQDQHGSKIVYIVDKRATIASSSSAVENIGSITTASPLITVKENGEPISTDSIFIILTTGKNKIGAFSNNSALRNGAPTNANELENSFSSIIGGNTITADSTFIKSAKGDGAFDDEVFFKDREALISDFKADFLIPCQAEVGPYNQKGVFGQIIYASSNCPAPNQGITPAKKCGSDGKWIYEKSCPCFIQADGIESISVPNGEGILECKSTNLVSYSGVLKYRCSEATGSTASQLTILEPCKRSCAFSAIGVNQLNVPNGSSQVSCDQNNYRGKYIVICENGLITSSVGGCSNSVCSVGGYSGMKPQNISSGSSGTLGACESGYSGNYSFTCADGVSNVSDFCYQDCQFSALGIPTKTLKNGSHKINCDSGYLGNAVTLSCKDGIVSDISGSCYLNNTCSVGNGLGMIPKSVAFGTVNKTDGECSTGFGGDYYYSCSTEGKSTTTNNCLPSQCSVGKGEGMVVKSVNKGTSGEDGVCSSGYGGYYKWNCSNQGVGSVVENNCVNSCRVGLASQAPSQQSGEGMIEDVVGFGKSGNQGLCNNLNNYVGTYSWSCLVNSATKKVEGLVTNNNCKNKCEVGTSAQGSGMIQKFATIGSSGVDGKCASGYAGSYEWSCDSFGYSKVTNNKCVNRCLVGTSNQGIGMISKEVIFGASGSENCSDATGYSGTYSWACSAEGVGTVTSNSCALRTCTVGNSTGMISKIVNAGTSGTDDGACANGYNGSFSWACSYNGVGSVTNNCLPIKCNIPTSNANLSKYTDLAYSETQQAIPCATGFYGSVNYTCMKPVVNGNGTTTVTGFCTAVNCGVDSVASSSGFRSDTIILYSASPQNYYCTDSKYDNFLTASFPACTSVSTLSSTSNNCVKISCPINSSFNVKQTSIFIGDNQTLNCREGYSKAGSLTVNASCSVLNATRQDGMSVPHSGSLTASACNIINCTISGNGYTNKVVSGEGSFSCDSGYIGTIGYTCTNSTTATTTGSCAAITCTTPAGKGYSAQNTLAYGNGSIICGGASYTTYSGSATYTCQAQTQGAQATITKTCDCASGFAKDSNGTCVEIKCSSNGTSYNGIPSTTLTNLIFTGTSTGTVNCSGTGYTGTANYTCTGTTNPGNFAITSSCDCTSGYQKNISTGSCGVIQCNTSIAGFVLTAIPYSNAPTDQYCNDPKYDNFYTTKFSACTTSQTLSPASTCGEPLTCSTAGLNVNQASIAIGDNQTLYCNTGYSPDTITTNCGAVNAIRPGDGASVPHTAALSGTSGTCNQIRCTVPNDLNTSLTSGSLVNFTLGTTSVNLRCNSGFASSSAPTLPSYTCKNGTGTAGTYSQTGTCNAIKCTSSGNGYLPQSTLAYTVMPGTGSITCDQTGYTGNANYTCQVQTQGAVATITKICDCDTGFARNVAGGVCAKIQCTIPTNSNTTSSGALVDFTTGTTSVNLYCSPGFSSSLGNNTPPSYTCKAGTGTAGTAGTYLQTGSCNPTQCTTITETGFSSKTVNYTTGTTDSSVCDAGYSGNVIYSCKQSGSLNLTTNGCTQITCSQNVAGFKSITLIPYSTTSKSYYCDDPKYDNFFTTTFPACDTSKTLSPASGCGTPITCSTTGLNVNQASIAIGDNQTLYCNTGYSPDTITTNCGAVNAIRPGDGASVPHTAALSGTSGTCARITCPVPLNINVTQGGTNVYFSSTPQSLTCVTGYTGSPTYTCNNSGTFIASGTACTQIICPISLVGISASTINFGSNTLTCGNGYSGTLSYNCGGNVCNDYATAYVDSNYSGFSVNYSPGSYDLPLAIGNDKMSSLKIPSGLRVTLYENGNYSGSNKVLTEDAPYFTNLTFVNGGPLNDFVSALKVTKLSNCVVQYSASSVGAQSTCTAITCTVPASANVTQTFVGYSSASTSGVLTCQPGYAGTPTYTCTNNGLSASFTASCARIKCTVPANSNTNLSGVSVDFTGTTSANLTCNSGFVSSLGSTTSPSYTCKDGEGIAGTYLQTGTCTPITCTVPSNITGFVSGTAGINFGTANYYCNATGYRTDTVANFTCSANANSIVGIFTQNSNNCAKITCNASAVAGFNAKTVEHNSFVSSLPCDVSGYMGSLTSNCTTHNSTITPSGSCSAVTCSLQVGAGYSAKSGLTYTSSDSGLTTTCDQTGYTGKIYYTCPANPTSTSVAGSIVSGSSCACASGYAKNASGVCEQINCTMPTVNTTLDATLVNYTNTATSLTCKAGFTGSPTYTCPASGTAVVTGTCTASTCTVPSNINVTQGGSTVNATSTAQSLTCASGYKGSPTYTCISGVFTSGGTACTPITCPVSIAGISNTSVNAGVGALTCGAGYTGTVGYGCGCPSITSYTNAGSGDSVKTIYDQSFASFLAPTNGIVKNIYLNVSGGLNNGGFAVFNINSPLASAGKVYALTSVTSLNIDVSADNFILIQGQTQSFQWTTLAANRYFSGSLKSDNSLVYTVDFDNKLGSCTNPTFSTASSCTQITCPISAGTGYSGRTLNYGSSSFACDTEGYTGTINYNCNAQNTPNLSGSCAQITCTIPTVNTTLDGNLVNYTKTTAKSLTCKTGFTGSPTYTCTTSGTAVVTGTCSVVAPTCTHPKIINPDFQTHFGKYSTTNTFTLSNWTLQASSTTQGDEGMAPLLFNVNSAPACYKSGDYKPYSAGFNTAAVTINITTPTPGYKITKFDWYGVSDLHGSVRNARQVYFEVYNGSSWVQLIAFELPNNSACAGSPNSYTFTNNIQSNRYRFRITTSWGSSFTKIRGFVFYKCS